jgi:hypothetical protein
LDACIIPKLGLCFAVVRVFVLMIKSVVLKSRDGLLDAGSSDSGPSMGIRIVWCTLALSL